MKPKNGFSKAKNFYSIQYFYFFSFFLSLFHFAEALDKLELRYAIAKAADFYEFVRIYSAGGAEPTLSQIVHIAELLFKDYQYHVLHHELLSNAWEERSRSADINKCVLII